MIKKCCDWLQHHQLSMAFIESASAGYLCSQFALYKNSGAEILLGGLVSYDPWIKIHLLDIPATLIQQHTAESIEVTEAMAQQGRILFRTADIIVACTGLLKSGGSATSLKPEGTFFISISYLNQNYNFRYFIEATPEKRLALLTEYVAEAIITITQGLH